MGKVRPGGTLLFIGATGGRPPVSGRALVGPLTAALPALTKNLALELAPIRVNLIATGFVDTTRRCRRRSSATTWTPVASSFARRCRSDASSARPTSPRSPCTS
jgi:NAD(P)-dependent dehydrogenase (short-subunit alcohol dehydrogenase family)